MPSTRTSVPHILLATLTPNIISSIGIGSSLMSDLLHIVATIVKHPVVIAIVSLASPYQPGHVRSAEGFALHHFVYDGILSSGAAGAVNPPHGAVSIPFSPNDAPSVELVINKPMHTFKVDDALDCQKKSTTFEMNLPHI